MLCQYTHYKLQRTISLKSVGLNLGFLFQIFTDWEWDYAFVSSTDWLKQWKYMQILKEWKILLIEFGMLVGSVHANPEVQLLFWLPLWSSTAKIWNPKVLLWANFWEFSRQHTCNHSSKFIQQQAKCDWSTDHQVTLPSAIESLSLINSPLPLKIWTNQIFIKISKI